MKDALLLVLQSGADILVCVTWSRLNFASLCILASRFDNGQWTIETSFVVTHSKSTRYIRFLFGL